MIDRVRLGMVPRAGVEPGRPYGQRILSPLETALPSLTKRYEPVFMGLAVVKVSLRLASYQHVPPPILAPSSFQNGSDVAVVGELNSILVFMKSAT